MKKTVGIIAAIIAAALLIGVIVLCVTLANREEDPYPNRQHVTMVIKDQFGKEWCELTEEEKEAVKAAEDEEAAEEPTKVSETDTAQEDKKKVTVRVIQTYKDKKAKQVFRPGFEFSISLKRAKELEAAKVAEIVTK